MPRPGQAPSLLLFFAPFAPLALLALLASLAGCDLWGGGQAPQPPKPPPEVLQAPQGDPGPGVQGGQGVQAVPLPVLAQADGGAPLPLAGPVELELRDIQVRSDSFHDDTRGLSISFRGSVKAPVRGLSLSLRGLLTDAAGRPLPLTDSTAPDDLGSVLMLGSSSALAGEAFVPYRLMDLPAGPQKVRVRVESAEGSVQQQSGTTSSSVPVPVKLVGALEREATFVKPPCKAVQVAVASLEVSPTGYDAALFRPQKALPDLMWEAYFGPRLVGTVHRSTTIDDTYSAEWDRGSPPFPFSEGDVLTIGVFDEDVGSDDLIGEFTFTLDRLEQQAQQNVPLKRGKVLSLVFGPFQIR